jgi:hypothetical protein
LKHFFLSNLDYLSWSCLAITIGLLNACTNVSPPTFYHQSGGVVQVVRCPVGEYELCLLQISNACQEAGYSIHEKVRQVKSGMWSDRAETLILAQCNPKLK